MDQHFEVKASNKKLIVYLIGLVIFTAIGIEQWISIEEPTDKQWITTRIGVPFFGLGIIMFIKQLFSSEPQIRVGANGILYRSWSDQTILWQDIQEIFTLTIQGHQMVCLILRDPKKYPSSGLLGTLAGANKAFSRADISLPLTGTDKSLSELMDAISFHSGRF